MSDTRENVSLADVYEFRSGLSKPRSAFGSGAPFLSFKDVFYNSAVPDVLNELVESSEKEQHNCSVKRGDVFLTRTSETMDELGMSCVALKDIPGATFNGFCKRLRPRVSGQIVPEYARYFFRSKRFRDQVNAMATMSTRASLNNEMLERLTIDAPSVDQQSAIGTVLGTLDDKIELNQKMNQTLEEIAKAIFKSWFVDFDPVRAKAEGRPTGLPPEISDLFPDELVDSEIGEIPNGWDIRALGSVFSIQYGKNLPKKNLTGEGYPVFGANGVIGFHSTYLYEEPMTLIGCRGVAGNVGRSLPNSFVTNNSLVINHEGAELTSQRFIEFSLASGDPENYVTGSAQPQLTIDKIKDFPFMTPPSQIVNCFQGIVGPIADRQLTLNSENQTLAELRDTLLPKLMSGELRIPDAEKFLEEAGI